MDELMKGGCVMPVWIVKGARKDDGAEVQYEVEAETEVGARQRANDDGVLVEVVVPPIKAAEQVKAYGLTTRQAEFMMVVGLLLAPAGFGLPLFVWALLANNQCRKIQREQEQARVKAGLPAW